MSDYIFFLSLIHFINLVCSTYFYLSIHNVICVHFAIISLRYNYLPFGFVQIVHIVKLKIDRSKAISRDQQKFSYISWLIDFPHPLLSIYIHTFSTAYTILVGKYVLDLLLLLFAIILIFMSRTWITNLDCMFRSSFNCATWNGHLIKLSFVSLLEHQQFG